METGTLGECTETITWRDKSFQMILNEICLTCQLSLEVLTKRRLYAISFGDGIFSKDNKA